MTLKGRYAEVCRVYLSFLYLQTKTNFLLMRCISVTRYGHCCHDIFLNQILYYYFFLYYHKINIFIFFYKIQKGLFLNSLSQSGKQQRANNVNFWEFFANWFECFGLKLNKEELVVLSIVNKFGSIFRLRVSTC